ncbi:Cl-channel protein [Irpex lacteus]|nr:Cl-channel protein [Irpex lacteus]
MAQILRQVQWLNSLTSRHDELAAAEAFDLSESRSSSFELLESGRHASRLAEHVHYKDGSSIDWQREEAAERERKRAIHSQRGVRSAFAPVWDSTRIWLVIIATGIGIGVAGAWLDVLVRWLGDLREGRCEYGFFYNSVACCSGLDAGEVCQEWKTWSQYFHVSSILGSSLLQSWIYICLSIALAASASVLVVTYAPYAFHTGIPEIKAIVSGYVFDAFLGGWTLLIKAVGLALAVASGLSLGKEGPLVHVSCCMAYLFSKFFRLNPTESQAQKRKLLAAAASAGVSVAFGSPLGGVLFGLEELDTFAFSNESDVMWRGFVISVIAAVSLQYVDPFGTSKLVLFQVSGVTDTWKGFELIPACILAAIGGVVGSLLIRLNATVAVFRHNSALREWPVLEVVGFTAITAAVSYLVIFCRVQSSELVANLFQECDPTKGDYHGLCNPTAIWRNIFLLTLTAAIKVLLTAWTFGMMVPAGIFLPTITIGACLGRAMGLITFTPCLSSRLDILGMSARSNSSMYLPGFLCCRRGVCYVGRVTRMTVSLVVIVFELTGALSHVLPIMISVVGSKWVADALGKEGIYSVWIAMRSYPWLPPSEYRDKGQTAASIMKSADRLVIIHDDQEANDEGTISGLKTFVEQHVYHGFPVVTRGNALVGFVVRDKVKAYLDFLSTEAEAEDISNRQWTFTAAIARQNPEFVDLSPLLDEAVLQLRKEVPLQLVVDMFKKMNLRHVLFSHAGKLTGLVTKTDIVWLLTAHLPRTGALSEPSMAH